MTAVSLGDLAQSYMLRQRNSALKQDMNRLTTELATGQVADVRQVLAGNYSYLTEIERKTDVLSGYRVATSEATHFASTMQTTLGRLDELTQDLSSSLLTAGTSASNVDTASEARNALNGMIGTLNTDIAGRYMFSGTATDQPPLVDAETLLNELKSVISGATTPADVMAAASAWFDSPTGYVAFAYQGATDPLSSFAVSQTENVTLDVRATDPGISKMLRLAAVAALADDPAFGLDVAAQSELYAISGREMLATQNDITALRANVGYVEARIDTIAARNAAEVTSLSFAKAALLEVDPFETATQLEEVQFQLQSLYSVTVRMSQLSLVNFL
jgi:flagellar hook-associated protein 3 FlgL